MRLDNKGSTMVEITIGFLLLIILFASFIKIIDLSSQMTDYSIDVKNKNLEYEKMYYGIEEKSIVDAGFRELDDIYIVTSGSNQNISDSSGTKLQIQICELNKDDFFAWVNDSTTNAWSSAETSQILTLNNISLKRLENINDENASKIQIFKYVYTPPVVETTTPP